MFKIWPSAQLIEEVSSRACGSFMLATPSQQTKINATHSATSNHRGIKRRTLGANVAATNAVQTVDGELDSQRCSHAKQTRPPP